MLARIPPTHAAVRPHLKRHWPIHHRLRHRRHSRFIRRSALALQILHRHRFLHRLPTTTRAHRINALHHNRARATHHHPQRRRPSRVRRHIQTRINRRNTSTHQILRRLCHTLTRRPPQHTTSNRRRRHTGNQTLKASHPRQRANSTSTRTRHISTRRRRRIRTRCSIFLLQLAHPHQRSRTKHARRTSRRGRQHRRQRPATSTQLTPRRSRLKPLHPIPIFQHMTQRRSRRPHIWILKRVMVRVI